MMLNSLIESLKKEYGASAISNKDTDFKGAIPSGSINLDLAIGVGGFPIGKMCEIYGPESSGKSTVCMSTALMAQKLGKGVVYIDAENSFHPVYAQTIGLDLAQDKFLLIQPDTAEQGLEIVEMAVQDKNVGLVILDSIAAMVPTKESVGQGEIGDSHVGLIARLMTQFSRRITPTMKNKSNAVLLMVNQVRENISGGPYASIQTPGGRALKHAMSVRVKVGRKKTVKDTDEMSIVIDAQIVKNKVSMPYKECEFSVKLGKGISFEQEIAEILLEDKIVKKSGSWYKDLDGNNIGQGIDSVISWINSNPKIIIDSLNKRSVSDIYVNRFNEKRNQDI